MHNKQNKNFILLIIWIKIYFNIELSWKEIFHSIVNLLILLINLYVYEKFKRAKIYLKYL